MSVTFTGQIPIAYDHAAISGLSDDDHTIYLLADGTRALGGNLSMGSNVLTNLADPGSDQDAATKVYVDTLSGFALSGANHTHNGSAIVAGTVGRTFLQAMVGAAPTFNGTGGAVPAPTSVESGLFLRGDATWNTPAGAGDMSKAVYDIADNGIVDYAEAMSGTLGEISVNQIMLSTGITSGHITSTGIHFTIDTIDHTSILNIGTLTHAQIESDLQVITGSMSGYLADHGNSAGLLDDDHTQYLVLDPGSAARNTIQASSDVVGLTVQGNAGGASANTFEVLNNSAALIFDVDDAGIVTAAGKILAQGFDANTQLIENVLTPVSATDAATKAYVDALSGEITSAPFAPSSLGLTDNGPSISWSFNTSVTEVHSHEIYRNVGNSTASEYKLLEVVPSGQQLGTVTGLDDTFDVQADIFYRVYSVHNGVRSALPLTGFVSSTGVVADPTNMSVVSRMDLYHVEWDLPNDRRLDNVTLSLHTATGIPQLSEGSAIGIYTGRRDTVTYVVNTGQTGLFHKFWVTSNTKT